MRYSFFDFCQKMLEEEKLKEVGPVMPVAPMSPTMPAQVAKPMDPAAKIKLQNLANIAKVKTSNPNLDKAIQGSIDTMVKQGVIQASDLMK